MAGWEVLAALGNALPWLQKMMTDRRILEQRYGAMKQFPDLNVLLADGISREAAILLQSTGFGLAKAQGLPVQGAMTNLPPWHKKIIKTLKPYLDKPSIAAIVRAYSLMRLEDLMGQGVNPAQVAEARREYFRRDESFRRRVYNTCRSGFLQDIVYEFACDVETEGLPIDDASDKVQAFFDRQVNWNPLNIYVNDLMGESDIFLQIREHLNKGHDLVRVYARGDNWHRVQGLTREFAEAHDLKHHVEDQWIGKARAGCCRLWNGERSSDFASLERELEAALIDEARETG